MVRLYEDRLETMIEEANEDYVATIEREFRAGAMDPAGLGEIPGTTLQHLTSLTFAGPDRRTVFLGTLHGTHVWRSGVRLKDLRCNPSRVFTFWRDES